MSAPREMAVSKVFLRDPIYDKKGNVVGFIETPATLWVQGDEEKQTQRVTLDPPPQGGYHLQPTKRVR